MKNRIAVVDLFAGPGGLAEGFSAVETPDGFRPFKVALSLEKESAAHSTLLLRTFLRQFESGFPDEYYSALRNRDEEPCWAELYPAQWKAALHEARQVELGSPAARQEIPPLLAQIRRTSGGNTVLIGGPPCQAYSLVGRARNKGIKNYVPEEDHRHFLYKEYLRILRQLEPLAFVMENVKGFLSASIGGNKIFTQVLADLRSVRGHGGYRLFALSADGKSATQDPSELQPSDFIVRAERFGIPQARHRVIVVGIRNDIAAADGRLQAPQITPGGGRLVIRTSEQVVDRNPARHHQDVAQGNYVALSVSDTGVGIPDDVLPRIFEPFFTTKEAGKGTGLGLATVFGIVKQHGGLVQVESEPGQGATFRVLLPARTSAHQDTSRVTQPMPAGGTETILLVEDERDVRLLTRVVLERAGYTVVEASDGIEALTVWEQHRADIHLLFTDLVMPGGVGGRELAAQLVASRPGLKVVFTSGYSADIAGRELSLQDGQNFIQKPFSPAKVLEAVRRCLDA